MSVSSDYLAYVLDQLAAFAHVRSRRMFGGVGLYADDLFFALIDDDCVYFKVDDANRPDYVARGCEPFRPFPDDPTYSMSYYRVPEEVLEDPDELRIWARKSVAAALSSKKPKAPPEPKVTHKSRSSGSSKKTSTRKARGSKRTRVRLR